MTHPTQLTLYEEVLLLALSDDKGTIVTGSMYPYALGGALLAELLLQNRIVVNQSGKKMLVHCLHQPPTGQLLLDDCMSLIRNAPKEVTLETWVARFANLKNLKQRVADRLCERGILRVDQDKVLFLFPRRIYPENDHRPEEKLIQKMQHALFVDDDPVDARTIVILSLAKNADLLQAVFDRKERKLNKDRLERIINGECMGEATRQVIEAVQSAIYVAAIMPAIITTTTATH